MNNFAREDKQEGVKKIRAPLSVQLNKIMGPISANTLLWSQDSLNCLFAINQVIVVCNIKSGNQTHLHGHTNEIIRYALQNLLNF